MFSFQLIKVKKLWAASELNKIIAAINDMQLFATNLNNNFQNNTVQFIPFCGRNSTCRVQLMTKLS